MDKSSFSMISSLAIFLLILITFTTISARGCAAWWRLGSNPPCTKQAIEAHCKTNISTSTHHFRTDLHDIAGISFDLAIRSVENIHTFLFSLYKSNMSAPSYMRERYFSCFKNYVDAKSNLVRAKKHFLLREYVRVGREVSEAINQGNACRSVYSDSSFKGVSEYLRKNRKFEQLCCISNAASSCFIIRPQISSFNSDKLD